MHAAALVAFSHTGLPVYSQVLCDLHVCDVTPIAQLYCTKHSCPLRHLNVDEQMSLTSDAVLLQTRRKYVRSLFYKLKNLTFFSEVELTLKFIWMCRRYIFTARR